MVQPRRVTKTVLRYPMTTTPTEPSEGPTDFRRDSYESQCQRKPPSARTPHGTRAINSARRTSLRVGRISLHRCPHCGTGHVDDSPAPTLPNSAHVRPTVAPDGGQRCG